MKKPHIGWIFIAIILTSIVLRPPVAQIGPILDLIQQKLRTSDGQTALLASIPVLCFGFGAFAAPVLVRRFGLDRTMVWLLGLLVVAIALRPIFGFGGMLVGTVLAGLSIAVANVLLPSIVRERFPNRIVPLTSAYTTILASSASFAAAFSYPTAHSFGWQLALQLWALPALLAFLVSFTLLNGSNQHDAAVEKSHRSDLATILKSPISWSIIGLFGIQSLGFYALLAWLPNLAIDSGMKPADAGALLSLMTIVGVPVGLVLSSNFAKFRSLAGVGAVISVTTAFGLVLLTFQLWVPAVIIIGIGQASSFPLSLSLISTRAASQGLTTMLSSVAQGIGYLLAAAGTFVFGWLAKLIGDWTLSIWGLVALTIVQVFAAWYAGRDRLIK